MKRDLLWGFLIGFLVVFALGQIDRISRAFRAKLYPEQCQPGDKPRLWAKTENSRTYLVYSADHPESCALLIVPERMAP